MKKFLSRSLLAAVPLTTVLAVATATPASAHERRNVGNIQFVVGFASEPAYSGFMNAVELTLSEANGGPPVTDVTDTVNVEVIKGADKETIPMKPAFRVGAFGTPGQYKGYLTPTRPGSYTFHFTGTIRGQNIDESFTSSPTTFGDVEDASTIQFPAKDPSTGQLASRVDRELPRVSDASDEASTAKTIGIIGIIAGILGLVVGGAALAMAGKARKDGSAASTGGTRADQAGSLSR